MAIYTKNKIILISHSNWIEKFFSLKIYVYEQKFTIITIFKCVSDIISQ